MRIFFTTAVLIAAAITSASAQNYVYDFVPQIEKEFFQMVYDKEQQTEMPEAVIHVKFDENAYWVSGYPSQCYVLDANGEKVTGWKPDFSGPADDYTLLYLGVMGLSQYVDANYTLVIPQGLLGNSLWNFDGDGGRSNPELRYDFNIWELADRPRENHTVYDFDPVSYNTSLEETRIHGNKVLELQLSLDFPEAAAISGKLENVWSVRNAEGEYLQEAILRAWVAENNPNSVTVGLRGVDLNTSSEYTISIWQGAFGNLEWAAGNYCEGRSNSPLEYVVNPLETSVETTGADNPDDAPVYNLQGMQVDGSSLAKGIYIRDGRKVIVR